MVSTAVTPGFHEAWFGEDSQDALADYVRAVADVPGALVEVGSWEGRSTVTMANAAWPRMVHAVDTWEGSPGEVSAALAATRDVFAQFQANVHAYTQRNVAMHRKSWREFMPGLHGPVALVFIDAEHTYREVFDTIAAFRPLMSPGGIICGDDNHHRPIQRALLDSFDPHAINVRATLWSVTV